MFRFVTIFLLILVGLFTLEMLESVHSAVVEPFTNKLAWLSAALMTPFDDSVIFYGKILQDAG